MCTCTQAGCAGVFVCELSHVLATSIMWVLTIYWLWPLCEACLSIGCDLYVRPAYALAISFMGSIGYDLYVRHANVLAMTFMGAMPMYWPQDRHSHVLPTTFICEAFRCIGHDVQVRCSSHWWWHNCWVCADGDGEPNFRLTLRWNEVKMVLISVIVAQCKTPSINCSPECSPTCASESSVYFHNYCTELKSRRRQLSLKHTTVTAVCKGHWMWSSDLKPRQS